MRTDSGFTVLHDSARTKYIFVFIHTDDLRLVSSPGTGLGDEWSSADAILVMTDLCGPWVQRRWIVEQAADLVLCGDRVSTYPREPSKGATSGFFELRSLPGQAAFVPGTGPGRSFATWGIALLSCGGRKPRPMSQLGTPEGECVGRIAVGGGERQDPGAGGLAGMPDGTCLGGLVQSR